MGNLVSELFRSIYGQADWFTMVARYDEKILSLSRKILQVVYFYNAIQEQGRLSEFKQRVRT